MLNTIPPIVNRYSLTLVFIVSFTILFLRTIKGANNLQSDDDSYFSTRSHINSVLLTFWRVIFTEISLWVDRFSCYRLLKVFRCMLHFSTWNADLMLALSLIVSVYMFLWNTSVTWISWKRTNFNNRLNYQKCLHYGYQFI